MDSFEAQVDSLLNVRQERQHSHAKHNAERKPTVYSEDGSKFSSEEILYDFLCFMKNLPTLIESEKSKLVNLVRRELQIDQILKHPDKLNFEKLSKLGRISSSNRVLSQLSRILGKSLNILAPPTTRCLLCFENLSINNPPSQIVVHGMNGPEVFSKYILRCKMCKLDATTTKRKAGRQDIYYHPERYGNYKVGWLFYETDVNFVKASNEVYFEKLLVERSMASFMHGFMSMEAEAEAYNETFRGSEQVEQIKLFLNKNPNVGKHFEKKIKAKPAEDEYEAPMSDDFNEKEAASKGLQVFSGMHEMHRKSLSAAFYNLSTLLELQERNLVGKYFFGPYHYEVDGMQKLLNYKESVDNFQRDVDKWRTDELYTHDNCTTECKKRGCERVFSSDGLWKLGYPICMMDIDGGINEELHEYIPTTCSDSPLPGHAFCSEHCQEVKQLGYPTELKAFLKSCSDGMSVVNPDEYSKEMMKTVNDKIKIISRQLKGVAAARSATDVQGTSYLLRKRNLSSASFELEGDSQADCNKDTGNKMRLRRWTRGVFVTLSGGGIIKHWAPLFRSESPTQVAMIMIKFLCMELGNQNPDTWGDHFLSYDNMCNVDRMRFLSAPLPLEGEFSNVWSKVTKVIDPLHVKNHKRSECKEVYAPSKVTEKYPEANLMIAEQTFAWMGRFKRILNSMSKVHFHFMLHRMIKRRNRYTEYCHASGKYPLLPSAKVKK